MSGRTVLQSGYFEHDRNSPKRPRLMIMSAPHAGHFSSVVRGGSPGFSPAPGSGLVLRQVGKPVQARKRPKRPSLMAIDFPHFSHFSSVMTCVAVFFGTSFSLATRFFLKGP